MILFLDFDGVLHPLSPQGMPRAPFSRLPLLEDVLREFRSVRVVLTTAWRHSLTLEQLREVFSKDIAPRIVDATPAISRSATLYEEVRSFLDNDASLGEDWVVLCAESDGFPPESNHLIRTQSTVGLTRPDQARLRARLRGDVVVGRLTIRHGEAINVYAFNGSDGQSSGYVRLAEMPEAFCTAFRGWARPTAIQQVRGEVVAVAQDVMQFVVADPVWWMDGQVPRAVRLVAGR